VSGVSLIKWHLPPSIHGEHRGRTPKCPLANHRVEYNYSKVVPVRIAIDRNNNLSECELELEVLQEFSDEKMVLGKVALNLSEYVEESEAILRDTRRPGTADSSTPRSGGGHARQRSSLSTTDTSPTTPTSRSDTTAPAVEAADGVVRRYLMQESKINSTLKVSILMIQVDGERGYVAPALKTAPVFGGIAGIVAGPDTATDSQSGADDATPHLPASIHKSRDASELQDMYRRALAASWACQPGEMPADQCIEDIFHGGDGFRAPSGAPGSAAGSKSSDGGGGGGGGGGADHPRPSSPSKTPPRHARADRPAPRRRSRSPGRMRSHGSGPLGAGAGDSSGSGDDDGLEMTFGPGGGGGGATLRPRDARQFMHAAARHHVRHHSGTSERSVGTVTRGDGGRRRGEGAKGESPTGHRPGAAKDDHGGGGGGTRSRSESLTSLAPTLGSERGREEFRRVREVTEYDIREDLTAWSLRPRGT